MKPIIRTLIAVLLSSVSTAAFAAGSTEPESLSWLTITFLFFGALIIVFQMIPGLTLFFAMVRGLFSATEKVPGTVPSEPRKR